ncbi:uncharacterized protein LOC112905299 [Agrilus planipennis]|uniref:Uncharacterized protein LOC112905299 n=1 Tax=Agrilus planipennis TaxID=224129 RepID=A0A7F5RB61_AGRPL|nr:uncharacterized protein LOC112905299 [Agrilus planipennis]
MKVKTIFILLSVVISGVLLAPAPKGGVAIGAAVDATKAIVGTGAKFLGKAALSTLGTAALKIAGTVGKVALVGAGALGIGLVGAKLIKLKIAGAKALLAKHSGGGSWSSSSSSSTSTSSSEPSSSTSDSDDGSFSASGSINASLYKRK